MEFDGLLLPRCHEADLANPTHELGNRCLRCMCRDFRPLMRVRKQFTHQLDAEQTVV